jgi:hypothetical protein
MVKYTLFVQVKDTNGQYSYELDLKTDQRNTPQIVFTKQQRREMQHTLENKSECRISDICLENIIKTWLLDIQEDYRETFMVLDLPSLLLSNIGSLQEQGYQTIPEIRPPSITDIEPAIGMPPPLNFC